MTRVVHVVVAGEVGGAERMLVDLASRPEASRAEHSVALLSGHAPLERLLRNAGLRVLVPPRRAGEGPLPFLWQSLGPRHVAWLEGVLREERAHVAHLHTFASQVVGTRAALRTGIRVLRTEHSTRVYDDPSCWPFSRWSLARADACAAVSDHVRVAAVERAPWAAGKLRVVANGVDVDHFVPREVPRAERFTFTLVGRLERRKGVDLALEALARLPNARLEVIGDGKSRASLERLARRRGLGDRVRFHGDVQDTRHAMACADAVLCPSRAEGLGIALLEAMAMARPVVGFSVGGVPEIVQDGRTGLLAPAGDLAALAARMRDAVTARDQLPALGVAARVRVVDHFSVGAMCERYARVYDELRAPR